MRLFIKCKYELQAMLLVESYDGGWKVIDRWLFSFAGERQDEQPVRCRIRPKKNNARCELINFCATLTKPRSCVSRGKSNIKTPQSSKVEWNEATHLYVVMKRTVVFQLKKGMRRNVVLRRITAMEFQRNQIAGICVYHWAWSSHWLVGSASLGAAT